MNDKTNRVEAIFQAAMELSSQQERESCLQRGCGEDVELRREVEELLRAAVEAEEVFETREAEGVFEIRTGLPALEQTGSRISQYHLLQKIGEGGCGVVYMAEQEMPLRRKVALKIVKLGMDTRQVIARFEAERQALALMDHPNIAKVLDAGATQTGRPYFVMELVPGGQNINEYCDKQRFSTGQRLDLFIRVCQAVQHAHQKGVIHRDLKPSNILITEHDGVPVPKVIDFGIVKATGDLRLTDKTMFTAFEQFLGTPAYMSPEQARLGEIDIDTRSDVYSLGVLLYELLTGETPFDTKALRTAGLDEMRRIIREREPVPPSTRLRLMPGEKLTATATNRQVERSKLAGLLRGDLDWIVMKCLEKDRTRRYESANAFARDIERYLAHERVSAAFPSMGYRLRKFARRNKTALGVVGSLAFLAVALLVSLFLLFKELGAKRIGGIAVNSNPEGAEVWYRGQRVGSTPCEFNGVPLGEFVYRLVLSNYESVTITNNVVPKEKIHDFTFLRRVEPTALAANLTTSALAVNLTTNFTELRAFASRTATLLTIEGDVQVAMRGTLDWTQAVPNTVISGGDRLRTGPRSRATLRWLDDSVVSINELTSMEIISVGEHSFRLNNGKIFLIHQDGTSNSLRVITSGPSVGVEG